MPKLVPNPPPGFDDLSVDEKIDYVESLWEGLPWVLTRYQCLTGMSKSYTRG